MSAYYLPYAVQCAEIAARRQSAGVRKDLQLRVASLASVASTAALIGLLDTLWGIMNCFHSIGGSKSQMLGNVTSRISESMAPGVLGLLVAVPAFCFYRYLSDRMEAFELELENVTVDLVNRLIVHVQKVTEQ